MKHQYFGDVNDYVKYGLLRCFSAAGLRVGVCWMLTPQDERPDGRKVQYLRRPNEWKDHDPDLYNHLDKTLNGSEGRHLRNIEGPHHIPGARFFGAMVPDSRVERSVWSGEMHAALHGCDLLFFDPDNGIQVQSKAIGQKDSSKYVYWSELQESWEHAKALLVFQHFPRVKRTAYIPARVQKMSSCLPDSSVIPLRSSNVLFLLAYRPADDPRISEPFSLLKPNGLGASGSTMARNAWERKGPVLLGPGSTASTRIRSRAATIRDKRHESETLELAEWWS